jgi:hypothetical protein
MAGAPTITALPCSRNSRIAGSTDFTPTSGSLI